MRPIAKREVVAAMQPYVWDFSNQILYDLCRNYPKHTTLEHVLAKVLLIGRVYAAALERRRKSKEEDIGKDFYQSIAGPKMLAADIDSWFAPLQSNNSPGSFASLIIHKRLQDLFFDVSNLEKRSLSSKYLHFHFADIFFLFDGRAAWAIRKVTPRRSSEFDPDEAVDPVYGSFVKKCLWLRNQIHEQHGIWLTPRQIDRLLLPITDIERKPSPRSLSPKSFRKIGKAT
jgi:hypothetical protein